MENENYTLEQNYAELQRRAAAVINEWHEDELSADAVSFLADMIPDELISFRSEDDPE
jgi:hypothetical protein